MSTTGSEEPRDESGGDYAYDLAHEDVEPSAPSARPPAGESSVPAADEPQDSDGDYSYDLAHEVPRSGQSPA